MNYYLSYLLTQVARSAGQQQATSCHELFEPEPRLVLAPGSSGTSTRAGSEGGAQYGSAAAGAGPCLNTSQMHSVAVCLRANFSYDPAKDSELPCTRAGLVFCTGDVLLVKDRDDVNWWKASRECDPLNIGLIPSPVLQKFRTACLATAPLSKGYSFFGRKKKQSKLKKPIDVSKSAGKAPYEEVTRVKGFEWKSLVLLGAHGVGRRHIKKSLLIAQPDKYAYPVPHTTRERREDEVSGHQYCFVSHDEMMKGIKDNDFLEYGQHEDAMYGIKLDTIRRIHQQGKMAILDVESDALAVLRCREFAPYVVFIEAPKLPGVAELDKSLESLVRDSETIRRNYEHTFNMRLTSSDIERTVHTLRDHLTKLDTLTHWVPVEWI